MKIIEFKMDVGPDGSLCRITSSAKGIVNNVKIVKISDEKLNSNEPEYKLVFIGEKGNDNDSLSEESDEETLMEEELFHQTNVQLSAENKEKKDKDVKLQEVIDEPKHHNKKFHKKTFDGRYRQKTMHRNHNNYNFSGTRNFNSSGSVTKNYKQSKAKTSSEDICPWVYPPTLLTNQYGMYQPYSSVRSVGLLGNSPMSFPQHNFQSNSQSNAYRHGQNFGDGDYSSSYQTASNMQISSPPVHNKFYQNNNWKNKKSTFWKRNRNERWQQERRQYKRHFN